MSETLPVFDSVIAHPKPADLQLTLTFNQRQKARLRVVTDEGEAIALKVQRGLILRDGTYLGDDTGRVLKVVAAPEDLSRVTCDDPTALARAAYHLGNRHVAVQIGAGELFYAADHVLDDMVRGLGFAVSTVRCAFEPESGAYGGHHQHSHD